MGANVITSFYLTQLCCHFFSLRIFEAMNTIVIDAGNTLIKVGKFVSDQLLEKVNFTFQELDKLAEFAKDAQNVALASVRSDADNEQIRSLIPQLILIDDSAKLPFQNNYGTKKTLGVDRACNAAYVSKYCKTEIGICVDIGTCIKFDVVHKKDGYLGGSISPGINLRYKSLNDYTGKLPLISNKTKLDIVGTNTETSLQSGVINGMSAEINGLMDQYRAQYDSLTFFMTGGDAKYFDIHSKNDIFADENLTLKGLYEILLQNA